MIRSSQKSQADQTYFQLASIQSVSLGIPVIIIGKQLSALYGPGIAICSIFVGNLILWLVGLAIISMVYQQHTNAIENIKGYIGKYGGGLFALMLSFAFLNWYAIQINNAALSLNSLFQYSFPWREDLVIRIGAAMGILAALLAIGGIRLLKWVTVAALPMLLVYNVYALLFSQNAPQKWSWGLSLPGIIATVLLLLPGVINLPTFFRHSRSRADSFLALTLMLIFITFFEAASIWMNFSPSLEYSSKSAPNFILFVIPTALFIIITSVCSNLLNIYLASACYETFIPKFEGIKGHAIIGLMGTAVYTFVQISSPIIFIANLLNDYIGVLGIVLIIAVLARIIIRHRPREFEKAINAASWLLGCVVATYLEVQGTTEEFQILLYSIGTSVLFFLCVFFIEETIWSIKKVKNAKS